MHRLFVAIRPPAVIRQRLLALMGGVANARWQDDDQLHLTLRFIGEVDRHSAEDIAVALAGIRHPAMTLALDGIGSFETRGHVDTLWAGVTPQEPLAALHRKIDRRLVAIGLPAEGRAYLPHITIARFGRNGGSPARLIEAEGGLSSAPFTVTEFHLYESSLAQQGPIYTLAARYPLA